MIAGANVRDAKLLEAAIVVERSEPTKREPQNLCLDEGDDDPTGREAAAAEGRTPRIRRIGEEKAVAVRRGGEHKPRRGVAEQTYSWMSKCRPILVRYDKNTFNHLGSRLAKKCAAGSPQGTASVRRDDRKVQQPENRHCSAARIPDRSHQRAYTTGFDVICI